MNLLLDVQILGWLLVGVAGFACVPLVAALAYGEPALPYVATFAAALAYGLTIGLAVRPSDRRMRPRDGFLVVSASWVIASLFGALPYVLSGFLSPVDALFESVAGFTTTGSSVMADIESAPRALLLWRSLTQWLGGMGIIVFAIAVLPLLGIGGMQLFKAEVPGPITDKLTPRISVTARRLWLIYVGLTGVAVAAYWLAGMSGFEAVCHAFTSLATGGFSTRNGSIGAFESPAIEWLVIVFMLAAGTNFSLHYQALTGRLREVAGDAELHLYGGLVLTTGIAAAWMLSHAGSDDAPLRSGLFQVISIVTTTGYATRDYELWPALTQFLLFQLLVVGGMAGSTAGGLKTLRLLLGFRALRAYVLRLSHPLAMRPVRHAGRPVDDNVVSGVAVFFIAYFGLAILGAAAVAAAGYDLVTALSASLTAIGNVGPGLGEVGPANHFGRFPGAVKLVLSFCMIAGRLEVLTVIVLFEPHFWRR